MRVNVKTNIKNKTILFVLSFFIPVAVMLCILQHGGFYPFGDKTMFIMDMKGQYLEFFASLRNIVSGDDSIFFSWSRSMGGNYLGLFAYYIASPFSFLTLFFSVENLMAGIVLLTLLKIGLCGLSFSIYGNYIKKESQPLLILPFAVSYALISYNMVYSMCLMWLDGVILLPLILLGVERILENKSPLCYILALTALFLCNYYTGYMAGIFTAIYLVFRVISDTDIHLWKERWKQFLWFALSTLLSIAFSAPLLLPVVKDLMGGKLSSVNYVPDTTTNFPFFSLFGKFRNGVYDSITNAGLPAIYCGYLVIILAVIYFFMKKIAVREKIGAAVILILFSVSFYVMKLDMVWHGFQYPNWFPYRYAFLCSFFLIYMAVRVVSEVSFEHLFAKMKIAEKYFKSAAVLFVCVITLCVTVELTVNGSAMLKGLDSEFGYGTVQEYRDFLDGTKPLVDDIKEKDSGFYRINQLYEYSKNDAMLLGYHGMTHYSSTFNAAINTFTPKLGIAQAHIWNSGYGSNPMLDSLFAVKYVLQSAGRTLPYSYTGISQSSNGNVSYENTLALPVAYSASVSNMYPDFYEDSPFANQNTLLNAIAGEERQYYTECQYGRDADDSAWYYHFTASSSNPVYLYMKADNTTWADVYVNDTWVGNYFSTETSCSLYLGSFEAGQQVTVKVVPQQATVENYAVIAELHMDLLTDTLKKLKEHGMQVTSQHGGNLLGTINVSEAQKVITSIPYDEGFTVKIDGKKVEMQKFADTFIAFDISSGQHEISFSYVSPGVSAGCILFVLSAAISVIIIVKKRKA